MLGLKRRDETTIAVERWNDAFADEAEFLGAQHFAEVENGLDPRRRFKLSRRLMALLDQTGSSVIVTARFGGKLVGYCTWQCTEDVESEGLLIAQQGAWFVDRGHEGMGPALFRAAVAELRRRGVQCIFPHHRMQGRGTRLGLFFQRLGAVLTQQTYMLWIGP